MHEEAVEEIERCEHIFPSDHFRKVLLALAHVHAGRENEALRLLEEVKGAEPGEFLPMGLIASTYADLGDVERALEWAERVCETHSSQVIGILADQSLVKLRSRPRTKRHNADQSFSNDLGRSPDGLARQLPTFKATRRGRELARAVLIEGNPRRSRRFAERAVQPRINSQDEPA